ncbi:MAG: hypothetical protein GX221_10945 [Candidatus Riflebacteria bacterium]|nr:hypothetical protein [Candidatus Riflebacteria bacterium]
MKVFKWLSIGVVAVFLVAVTVPQFMSYALGEDTQQQEEQTEQEEQKVVTADEFDPKKGGQAAPMSLEAKSDGGTFAAQNDKTTNATHAFEDTKVSLGEGSTIFTEDMKQNPNAPSIAWTSTATDEKGNPIPGATSEAIPGAENSTQADAEGYQPGHYSIGNHAARLVEVPEAVGGPGIDGGITEEEYRDLIENDYIKGDEVPADVKIADLDEKSQNRVNSRRVNTATANVQLVVHDVTPPDVWVALRECVGDVCTDDLQEKLDNSIRDFQGSPCGEDAKNLMTVAKDSELNGKQTLDDLADEYKFSYVTIDEGGVGGLKLVPGQAPVLDGTVAARDQHPEKKTVRFTLKGFLFDRHGRAVKDTFVNMPTQVHEEEELKRMANFSFDSNEKAPKGIYVRKNVPLQVFISSVDNRDRRRNNTNADRIQCAIFEVDKHGNETPIWEGDSLSTAGAVFRVPNYPRDKYADQPSYKLAVRVDDEPSTSGPVAGKNNTTYFESPIFVVDTGASFDTMRR